MKTISTALIVLLNMSFASAMTEGEIGGVVQAINNAEIKISTLATVNTTKPAITEYGAMIVSDCKANNAKLLGFFNSKGGARIQPSAKATDVDAKASLTAASIGSMKDKLFEDAYLDQQISMEKGFLDDLDSYIPQATRADFKQFLIDTRALVSQHWERAKVLRNPGVQLSEGEIAGIIKAVDLAEVALGLLVPTNSTNINVVDFASALVADHRLNLDQLAVIFQPSDILSSPKSVAIKVENDAAVFGLKGLKNKAFDIAYLDHQIAMDKAVMDEIDADLPLVTGAAFRAFLIDTKALVLKHWESAKLLRNSLNP